MQMTNHFLAGIRAYGGALRLIASMRLWGYFVVPALLSLILGLVFLGLAWNLGDDIGRLLTTWYPFEWGRGALERVANIFGGLLVGAVGLLLFKNLTMALSAPFMSLLSETVEKRLRRDYQPVPFRIPQMMSDLVRGLRIGLRNIVRELFFTLVLLLLGLFPLFSPFTAAGIFLVQAYYAGFGNMDFTLERHFQVRDSVRFVRRYRGLALGNGVVFLLILLTVVGFLFALPLGTVAATTETIKRLESGRQGH